MAAKRRKAPKQKTFIHLDRDGDYIKVTAVLKVGAVNNAMDDIGATIGAVLSNMSTPPIVMGGASKPPKSSKGN